MHAHAASCCRSASPPSRLRPCPRLVSLFNVLLVAVALHLSLSFTAFSYIVCSALSLAHARRLCSLRLDLSRPYAPSACTSMLPPKPLHLSLCPYALCRCRAASASLASFAASPAPPPSCPPGRLILSRALYCIRMYLSRTLIPAPPPPLLHVLISARRPSRAPFFPFSTVHAVSRGLRCLVLCRPRCLTLHPLTRHHTPSLRHYAPSLRHHEPRAAVAHCLDPSRAPWRALAAVWRPVAFYYAPLRPLGPLVTPSCRATLPHCARAPHYVVWTPAVPCAALSRPIVPRRAV
ncbi:hypothetical protein DENSPDRAFT_886957 [Dentipellis sp. KUC8613]|nr:hypothetical protein DENSPDRAFT_886957 [Dentipellis sp. KUC8613]